MNKLLLLLPILLFSTNLFSKEKNEPSIITKIQGSKELPLELNLLIESLENSVGYEKILPHIMNIDSYARVLSKEDIFLIGKIEIYKTLLKGNSNLKKAMIDEDSIKKLKSVIKKANDPFLKWFLQAILYDSEKLFTSPNYKDYLLQKSNNRFEGIEFKKMDKKVQLLFRWITLATSNFLDSPNSPGFEASFKVDLIPVMMDSLINIEESFFLMATNNINETIQLINSPKELKFFSLKEIKILKKKVIKEKTVEDILAPLTEESKTSDSNLPVPSNEDWLNEEPLPLNLKNLPKPSDDADWLQDF